MNKREKEAVTLRHSDRFGEEYGYVRDVDAILAMFGISGWSGPLLELDTRWGMYIRLRPELEIWLGSQSGVFKRLV